MGHLGLGTKSVGRLFTELVAVCSEASKTIHFWKAYDEYISNITR